MAWAMGEAGRARGPAVRVMCDIMIVQKTVNLLYRTGGLDLLLHRSVLWWINEWILLGVVINGGPGKAGRPGCFIIFMCVIRTHQ